MGVIDAIIGHENVKGMKSANWELIKAIERKYPTAEFECLYSGLDSFDHANILGIKKNLDGMFCCTPKNGKAMYECAAKGDIVGMRRHLDNILLMRDTMLANGLMMCFTYCMNILGIEGNFHQDYTAPTADDAIEIMRETLKKIGEIS
jgi:dihydrodipicolinate synthase/N-acetylneuraminate lyase